MRIAREEDAAVLSASRSGPSIPGILSWNPGENGRFPEGSKEI
ncbi:MAG: hypothetical protein ACLU8D_01820 [Enterocloster sp.]